MEKYKKLIAKAQEPLTDKEYLDIYIRDINRFRPHEKLAIKDTNSFHRGITPSCAQLYGFKDIIEAIGTTYSDLLKTNLLNLNEAHMEMFYQQDRHMEQTRTQIKLLHVDHYLSGQPLRSCTHAALVNPTTNNVLGTFLHIFEPEINIGLKVILELHGHKFGNKNCMNISNTSSFSLTDIERDVLFCVCLGINNRKDVANFLSVIYKRTISAETTVHDAFRRLYRKLNCNTSMQLLEFAVYNDLHLQIPQAFLPTGSYIMR